MSQVVLKKSFARTLKEYALVTLGILMYVMGWAVFLVPHNLVGGGVTGVASILQYATHGYVKMGYTYFVLNAGLLIASIFVLGRNFGGKTIFGIVLASIGLNWMSDLIPASFINSMSIQNGKLLSVVMGGVIVGGGIGITFSQGGSTGGTDIIALMVNKYRNVTPGKMILVMDACIITSSLFVPSYTPAGNLVPFDEKFTNVIYGFILVTVISYVVDFSIAGSLRSVQLMIVSKKYDVIADAITKDLHRGVTVLDGHGWYTKQDVKVLMVLSRKTDLNMMLKYIKAIDPEAFLSVSYVTGVYGKGFETIKNSGRK